MRPLVTILRLVRFPLVWTALADVLAGAAVATASPGAMQLDRLVPLIWISPAVYLFGMALNDVLDAADDRRAGRDRPLAHGDLSTGSAILLMIFLLGALMIGAACVNRAAQQMIAVTLAAVLAYNVLAKRWTPTAILLMAVCRAANILIGWAAVTGRWRFDLHDRAPYAWALLASVVTLTAVASFVSAMEKRHGLKRLMRLQPAAVVLGCLMLLPVADSVCVLVAWNGATWSLAWLAALPLVPASSAILRRMRASAG